MGNLKMTERKYHYTGFVCETYSDLDRETGIFVEHLHVIKLCMEARRQRPRELSTVNVSSDELPEDLKTSLIALVQKTEQEASALALNAGHRYFLQRCTFHLDDTYDATGLWCPHRIGATLECRHRLANVGKREAGLELTLDQLSAPLQDDYARTFLAIADYVASYNDGQQLKPTG